MLDDTNREYYSRESKYSHSHSRANTLTDFDIDRSKIRKNMVEGSRRSSSRRRGTSSIRSGKYSSSSKKYLEDTPSRYIENAVVAFEEFGEAQSALKLYEFRDKIRSREKLKRNVVIKIEVSFFKYGGSEIRNQKYCDGIFSILSKLTNSQNILGWICFHSGYSSPPRPVAPEDKETM